MKNAHSSRINAILNSTTNPAIKAALERTVAYARSTNGRFVADLERAKKLGRVEGVGVLAGPVKKSFVAKPAKSVSVKTFKAAKKPK